VINILSVISELNFGGGENRVLNLARSIDPKRFRLTVATLYSKGDANHCGTLHGQFAAAGVRVRELGLPHPSSFQAVRPVKLANTAATLAMATARLRQLIVETRADAVDAHLETALYTAVPAAKSARVPAAITLYSELDLWKIFDGQSYRRVVFPPMRRLNLRLCGAICTDSKARADDLRSFVGAGSPKVFVIPNGVRLDAPSLPRAQVLRKFDIPEGATVVGQVAGLVPFKGAAILISAAAQAIARGHDLYVLCVGDARVGPGYPAQLRRQAEQLGISNRVRIQGYPGNIADVWSIIDVHVHASSIDSLPNALIEGMSLGKPAVVSAVGAMPEHVDDGRTGLVIPPDDPAAAGAALLRLLDDRAFAARLGAAAHQRYLQRFTPEIPARAVEGLFESMIDAHKSRRVAAQ
jgi:glycosyltransferase involved in cell wall biosynthesis